MGDKVTIPRSFADRIGVADVRSSMRRHYLMLNLGNLATTSQFGGNSTTALTLLQRNAAFERIHVAGFVSTSISNGSTAMTLQMFDGATTIFSCPVFAGTTGSAIWISNSTTPTNTNAASGALLRFRNVSNGSHTVYRVMVGVSLLERLDS